MDSRLIQEIDRLFDELVHSPWRTPAARGPAAAGSVIVELPLVDGELGGIAIVTEGPRMTVIVSTLTHHDGEGGQGTRVVEHRQTFDLPPGAVPGGFEARRDGKTLRVRVDLHRPAATASRPR
jgi:hypothetical protein